MKFKFETTFETSGIDLLEEMIDYYGEEIGRFLYFKCDRLQKVEEKK